MLQCKKWTNWQIMPPATTQLSWFWKKSFRVKVSLERERAHKSVKFPCWPTSTKVIWTRCATRQCRRAVSRGIMSMLLVTKQASKKNLNPTRYQWESSRFIKRPPWCPAGSLMDYAWKVERPTGLNSRAQDGFVLCLLNSLFSEVPTTEPMRKEGEGNSFTKIPGTWLTTTTTKFSLKS